jgi:hypothetical protein
MSQTFHLNSGTSIVVVGLLIILALMCLKLLYTLCKIFFKVAVSILGLVSPKGGKRETNAAEPLAAEEVKKDK